ncbi:hypothetical protein GN244_ATG19787 [Phytophthora infestans]|uniref:Uncharacterized protein n=1 Tax=Phytophthora infestans TaxID=4787 RepID=A0A833WCN4_PHYIN|nr:hypothetical protein GN244_ATG19787 [Phytophthora infestans]
MDGLRDVELLELPCNTPIVMMTIAGDTLTAQSDFVKLIGSSDGFVTIQNANNKWQRLAHGELGKLPVRSSKQKRLISNQDSSKWGLSSNPSMVSLAFIGKIG